MKQKLFDSLQKYVYISIPTFDSIFSDLTSSHLYSYWFCSNEFYQCLQHHRLHLAMLYYMTFTEYQL